MKIFKEPFKLIQEISFLVKKKEFQLISVDGFSGSGKSHFAERLIAKESFSYINIDKMYYEQNPSNPGQFINFVKYEKLKSDLHYLTTTKDVVVIDGICILKILDKISFTPNIKIYVKKLLNGSWRDGNYLDYDTNVEATLTKMKCENQEFENICANIENREPVNFDSCNETMIEENIRYHKLYKPHQTADFMLLRKV